MSNKFAVQAVDYTLRKITKNNNRFGGKLMLFAGDFRQLMPVSNYGKIEESINLCMKRSHLWQNIQVKSKNLRIKAEEAKGLEFANYLLELGEDRIKKDKHDYIEQDNDLYSKAKNDNEFIEEVFGKLEEKELNFANKVILAP